ncbi:N-acetylglutamate synthase-like GNAT family acetyltransferase [Fontibacillus solani]|uniref:N-acetylglutamate synthase, GNAT family n=2 Tax=Fontibacillus TaxID=995014 RepID=A0A1G7KVJ9_9BACL|nr:MULTISPECIES: GNAT family N-acetyltransferase [Fontibacillus]MBA9085273.1 N-acetylglutamate synthase-like GNAT family acetyltransferase [Fontibacillus solani]SDF41141.1 N-acetylglutamate synthase, GNAT family [Fontibacillus panacisegetis]
MSSQVCAPALVIRKSCSEDVLSMLSLMRQLRYPTTQSVLKERLTMLESHPTQCSLVAELDGVVVGTIFLGMHQTHDMTDPVARITALIVDENHRRSGIGERLIDKAEAWGKERGSSELFVSIAKEEGRKYAKSFYENHGFTCFGYRLSKALL